MAKSMTHEGIKVTLHLGEDALTVEDAKKYLGWEEEGDTKFGEKFFLKTPEGKKVRLKNNADNRPFRRGLAMRWALEILRKKWEFNGESGIIDNKGQIQDCQHRLVGLIFAEQLRKKDSKWKDEYGWRSAPKLEMMMVEGVSSSPKVVDTIGTGQRRTLGDVMFRDRPFGKKEAVRVQTTMTNTLAKATRLVWLRAKGQNVSDAPHFPHSEALEFFNEHPRLGDAVKFILEADGEGDDGRKIATHVPLATAAGMMYLMGMSKTDPDKFAETGEMDDKNWKKAEDFWTLFASGIKTKEREVIPALRDYLRKLEKGSGGGRDEVIQVIINAWNLWIEGEEGGIKEIKPKRTRDDNGNLILADDPRIGGLDTVKALPEPEEEEEVAESEDEDGEEVPAKKGKKTGKGKTAGKAAAGKAGGKSKRGVKKDEEDSDPYAPGVQMWWAWFEDAKGPLSVSIKGKEGSEYEVTTEKGESYLLKKEALFRTKKECTEALADVE